MYDLDKLIRIATRINGVSISSEEINILRQKFISQVGEIPPFLKNKNRGVIINSSFRSEVHKYCKNMPAYPCVQDLLAKLS